MSPTMYRLPGNPYGSKTYLSSRTSDYGYSPTKYLNTDNYGSRDFRDSGVMTRDHDGYPPRDFRDSGIATMLKNDYQRKMESHYGPDYAERTSEASDKHPTHDKYLFPYTAEEDHTALRAPATPRARPQVSTLRCFLHHVRFNMLPYYLLTNFYSMPLTLVSYSYMCDPQQQIGAPLASMGETSEKSTTEDDAETRV
ncbi:hypothetical protein ACJJTC_008804 [Scirpophaga incertulas]